LPFLMYVCLFSTALILARLYLAERGQHIQLGRLTMRPVITVVLESGVIYCVTCIIGFALFFSGNNAQVIVLNGVSLPMMWSELHKAPDSNIF
jgi:hypothetical protein